MIHFSIPMPLDIALINKAATINRVVQKSTISTMYNCLPFNADGKSGFEQNRMIDTRIRNLDEFLRYVEAVQNKGITFVYLMNSLRKMSYQEFYKNEKRLRLFLKTLLSNGISCIRVASPLLIDYLMCNFPEVNVLCSTSQEYYSIKQYRNLLSSYKNIKQIIPSWEKNRNFSFLESFVELFPETDIELMVNEGCISGCPFRLHHSLIDPESSKSKNTRFSHFFTDECSRIMDQNFWLAVSMLNVIYPWQIDTYYNLGINHFKLVGRNSSKFYDGSYIEIYECYLKGIDDVNQILDKPVFLFNNNFCNSRLSPSYTVRDLMPLLPDIEYFSKTRPRCEDLCGTKCTKCYECAEVLEKTYPQQK